MSHRVLRCRAVGFGAAWLLLPAIVLSQEEDPAPDYLRDILPVLAENCFECHGPDEGARQAGLRLDRQPTMIGPAESGQPAIVPGDRSRSELYRRITSEDESVRMPPPDSKKELASAEIERIGRWIDEGADWREHWAFVPPVAAQPPSPRSATSVENPIDLFILDMLDDRLAASPRADRETLIRRVTLDLTGLPPTPEEVDTFVHNESPSAYQELVERLLASPRYGEQMAVPWLDAARYADTHGYLFDTQRTMWRWRDWVIDAYNDNLPFDEFTIQQLAGDLLPSATESHRIASGFNRNHIINNEAGATPQEYLVENILDRVNTTSTVWMGLTLACCQCHDHKYDPFTQREFYQLYAFFDNVPEVGLDGLNTNARPSMPAPTAADERELSALREKTVAVEQRLAVLSARISEAQAAWEETRESEAVGPTDGLLAHWPLDGDSNDRVSNHASTFDAAEPSYADGILAQATSLDGLGYLNAGDRFNFEATKPFSFAAWIRPENKVGRQSVFSRMADDKELFRGQSLQLVAGVPAFFLVHTFPDDMLQVQVKEELEPNRWHHLALTYDGSRKVTGVKIYVDGVVQEPTITIDQLKGSTSVDRPFWIGNGHPGAKLKGRIDEVRMYDRVLAEAEVLSLPGLSIGSLLAVPGAKRNEEQARRVREYYLQHEAPPEWSEPFSELVMLKDSLTARERAVPTVMVMDELDAPRETRVLVRGEFNKLGDTVTAGTPAVLPPLVDDEPRSRLALARWLTDPRHPLTARVTVNRIWQMHFGRGLVETSEDFGIQGSPPSHPRLLDWLAQRFVQSGWDVKALQHLIVTSATYQQSSTATAETLRIDPENRLLARGPRIRLSAESIRDQALAASGLLVEKIGGPSVKPYQPAGLWREVAFDLSGANLTAQIYEQDAGASLYRRSMYTFWKRTAPPPTMLLFDAPNRERCVARRQHTNTPLQTLVLWNDPTYVEAAKKLAERVLNSGATDIDSRLSVGFRLLLGRHPSNEELGPMRALLAAQQARFQHDPDAAKSLIAVGESQVGSSHTEVDLAAHTIVMSILFSLDETITRN